MIRWQTTSGAYLDWADHIPFEESHAIKALNATIKERLGDEGSRGWSAMSLNVTGGKELKVR